MNILKHTEIYIYLLLSLFWKLQTMKKSAWVCADNADCDWKCHDLCLCRAWAAMMDRTVLSACVTEREYERAA